MYYGYSYGNSSLIWLWVALIAAVVIYTLVVWGKIISKSGDKGWKVLIPLYGLYVFYKACDSQSLFGAAIAVSLVTSILNGLIVDGTFRILLAIIEVIVIVCIQIAFVKNTANAFNKSTGFAVGLFFLSIIFQSIIAFGSAQYHQSNGLDRVPDASGTWKCEGCGSENPVYKSTCSNCGSTKPITNLSDTW